MFKYIKEILKIALPAMGEMVLYMFVWVLDTMMVGKYAGKLGVSAVSLSSEIMYSIVNTLIGMGLSIAVTSIVARRLGAKKIDEAKEYADEAIKLGIIISFIVAFSFFMFANQILSLAGAEKSFINSAVIYMKICSVAMLFNMFSSLLNGVYRGCKDTKTPLIGAFIVNIVNLSLDYVLIFGKFGFPELGIKGAAIATSCAGFLCFVYLYISRYKLSFKISINKKFDVLKIKDIVKFSVPSAMQEGSFSIAKLFSVFMIMSLGSIAFSANQIAVTIESISFMPGWGLAIACTTLVGHSIGEGKLKEARKYITFTSIIGSVLMGIIGLIFFYFSYDIISLFIKKDEIDVIKLGSICLMIGAFEQIPMAIDMIISGAFKGAGDSKTPFKISFIGNWLFRLPLVYYFIYIKRMPVYYFWIISTSQWTLESIVFIIIYRLKFKNQIQQSL